MTSEFYTRPILRVRSVAASLTYYCEALGFTKMWAWDEDEPIIAQVGRDGLEMILDSASVIPKAAGPTVLSMSLHAADKLGALCAEFESRGARIVKHPFAVVWQPGVYQFDVEDLDGNRLLFWGDEPD
jgi:uncharacterized glyoxalase superfamily protein PhnB